MSGAGAKPTTVVVITGMSGAGKSTALHALEDLSFYCVDNLPTPLIASTLEVCERGGLGRVALGVDVRVGAFLAEAARAIDALSGPGRDLHVLFFDASDQALLRRYSETRRPHPLAANDGGEGGPALAVLDGVRIERERLAPLRARATHVFDTTSLSVHDLRRQVLGLLGPASGQTPRMLTRVVSFGFKYGMPVDADVVLDVRFLPNPFFVPELRDLPGTHPAVAEYVLSQPDALALVGHARQLLAFSLPRYEHEGKAYLTVAVGCTGGRHRSVVVAERLSAELKPLTGLPIRVVHRDVGRSNPAPDPPDVIGDGGVRGRGAP
ncbi:MAG TPA: RNase adapter RapZ [Polyangiaceae bacterium]|nr:RNase adapter RapZ [Polyangiaceae bacterium]